MSDRDRRRDFGQNTEIARDARTGQEIGRYSSGPQGKIHQTVSNKGKGKTTLHRDGNNHHHGAHASNGNSSFSYEGQSGKKRFKPGGGSNYHTRWK